MDNPNPVEDLGYAFVQRVASQCDAIWRRQSEKDIGVDGTIEVLRRDGSSAYIAVQVKSGPHYLRKVSEENKLVIQLGLQLTRLNNLNFPAIVVVHDPAGDIGYWESVNYFFADHPDALSTGRIEVPLNNVFDESAFDFFRQDLRAIITPRLSGGEIRKFLEINRGMSLVSFVPLALGVLNGLSISSDSHYAGISYLSGHGLVEAETESSKVYRPTEAGRKYVEFLLGGRYLLTSKLIAPKMRITHRHIYAIRHHEEHRGAATTRRERR